MAHITTTTKPIYFATRSGANIIHTGELTVGGALGTPLTVINSDDENTFLGAVVGLAGSYLPLPSAGAQLMAGEIYGYGGGLVIVRQSHIRTTHAPADVPALFSVYRAGATGALDWIANEPVVVGTLRKYNNKTYRCLQAHTTQTDWTPPATPALWVEVTVTTPGAWAVGVAYKVNDIVTYNGSTYKCLQAHTSQATWTPPAVPALWQKQ